MKKDYELQVRHIESIKDLIGQRGTDRLMSLALIERNWDGQDAYSMTTESLERMITFLRAVKQPLPEDLCYFFDHKGDISINWQHEDTIVDLCFTREATYFFFKGLDDGMIVDENKFSELKFYEPEAFMRDKQEWLRLLSRAAENLNREHITNMIRIINYNKGWGEHNDEKPLDIEVLETFVLFVEALTEVPDNFIFFPQDNGGLELAWIDTDNMRHEFEVRPDDIEIFKAPEYVSYSVSRKDLSQYKTLNDYLTGDFK